MDYSYNEKNKTYEIVDFNKALENCKVFIQENALLNVIIQNDDDRQAVKNSRTIMRKKKEEIVNVRKITNNIILGDFNKQSKQLEKLFDEADKILTKKLEDYDKLTGEQKKLSIIVSSYDEKVLEKVRAYALELKCEVK